MLKQGPSQRHNEHKPCKIALSVALVLATASAAVGYPADGDPSCFDRESCRVHDAVGQCVRERIRHDGTTASQRAPWFSTSLLNKIRTAAGCCGFGAS